MTSGIRLSLSLLACAFLLVGCSANDGRISIEGTVLRDGSPLDGASVAFVGNGGGAYGTAITNAEGKFTLRAAPGQNKVSVSKLDAAKAVALANEMPEDEEETLMGTPEEVAELEENGSPYLVAERFADPETSGIVIDVQEGMGPVDIAVTEK